MSEEKLYRWANFVNSGKTGRETLAGLRQSGLHLVDDVQNGSFRIQSGRDRSSDHQIIRSRSNRFYRSRDARLVIRDTTARTDARDKYDELRPARAPNRTSFVRGTNRAIHSRFLGQYGERDRAAFDWAGHTNFSQGRFIEARQNSNGEQLRPVLSVSGCFARSLHYGRSAGRMEREQTYMRKPGRARNGLGHSIRDVVEFQVEENPGACVRELLYRSRTFGCEQLTTDFEEPNCSVELPH
jgi:hypothetical protein